MSGHVTVGRVRHFRECGPADKALALKPLEEAMGRCEGRNRRRWRY